MAEMSEKTPELGDALRVSTRVADPGDIVRPTTRRNTDGYFRPSGLFGCASAVAVGAWGQRRRGRRLTRKCPRPDT